jgi:hypothetical protein
MSSEGLADAPLSEGFVLDPHRTSRSRFQWRFGLVAPQGPVGEAAAHSFTETVCLLESEERARLTVRLRFLQIQTRSAEGQGQPPGTWEQGVLHTKTTELALRVGQPASVLLIEAPGARTVENIADAEGVLSARYITESRPLEGQMRLHVRPVADFLRVSIRFENLAPWEPHFATDRFALLRRSFVGAHLVVSAHEARFVSLLEPPASAAAAVASCHSTHVHPVLVGPAGRRDLMLSSPILFQDYPAFGQPEPADVSESADIDEALSLRLMTMADWK